MQATTDIDIDLADHHAALAAIQHVPARQSDGTRHLSGVYFQDITADPFTGLATLDTKTAAGFGYFKIDLLNNTIYQNVRDEAHLQMLIALPVEWASFTMVEIVRDLHHIGQHFGIVQSIRPTCLTDLAVIVALIRPGKQYLVGQPRAVIDAAIWQPEANFYCYKKSHAYAYALSLIVQLNLKLLATDAWT